MKTPIEERISQALSCASPKERIAALKRVRWVLTTKDGEDGIDIIDANGNHVAKIEQATKEDIANARLIAAAPCLLEALRDLVHADDNDMGQSAMYIRFEAARAAIARATLTGGGK